MKTERRDGLTPEQPVRWEQLIHQAGEHYGRNRWQCVQLLEQARRIDDGHAGLHYLLGECYDALEMYDKAREAYIRAKELDICPLPILEEMNQAILETADRTGTPVVDVRRIFEMTSDHGIPDNRYLLDHVHPTIEGHQLIGAALCGELIRQGIVHPVDGWKEVRKELFQKHLDSLDNLYFLRGMERLEALRCWTQGKTDGAVSKKESS
ncbi:MAG TPA: SGNH/GDSL hydrolase family protein [Planctomycetaceae bacterium]|nr:SGNH/GDSL hydrolase family protein [Planctomycetaceae bacterium]